MYIREAAIYGGLLRFSRGYLRFVPAMAQLGAVTESRSCAALRCFVRTTVRFGFLPLGSGGELRGNDGQVHQLVLQRLPPVAAQWDALAATQHDLVPSPDPR